SNPDILCLQATLSRVRPAHPVCTGSSHTSRLVHQCQHFTLVCRPTINCICKVHSEAARGCLPAIALEVPGWEGGEAAVCNCLQNTIPRERMACDYNLKRFYGLLGRWTESGGRELTHNLRSSKALRLRQRGNNYTVLGAQRKHHSSAQLAPVC
uniref:Uncharacterized protein n=1 Tax=Chrysemys picta bellii TaxID=8478 RepID=A0A8C3FF74_CHRPI